MELAADKKFFLGVEGGATKSAAVLMDDEEKVVFEHSGEALNYHAIGSDLVREHLTNLLAPVFSFVAEHGGTIGAAIFGFAGLDNQPDEEEYRSIVRAVLGEQISFWVANDAVVNMCALCEGQYRVVVISGTGSIIYGANGEKTWRAGGHGPWMSDEGSGYDAGLRVLRATLRAADGRGPDTLIVQSALRHAGVQSVPELSVLVDKTERAHPEKMKSFIASFAMALGEAIDQNDILAKQIRDELAQELVDGVAAVSRKLDMTDEGVCVGLVGGLFGMPGFAEAVRAKISEILHHVYFSASEESGALGAARMAIKLHKNER